MYTYKLYFFVLYLLSLRWAFCSTGSEAITERTHITFDLSKLKEHGDVEEVVDNAKYKATTFTTPDTKVVDKVVYDGANVWVSSENGGKFLKKLVAVHRNDIPQLLHLVLTATPGASPEENAYYKKEKTQFTSIGNTDTEFNKSKSRLFNDTRHYVNEWYPMDFARSELYSGSTNQQRGLEDGVWKTTYTPLRGTAISVVKHGTTTMWTHAEEAKKVTSLELLEFGNDNSLLTISIGPEKKYFHKSGATANWATLEHLNAFKTKVTAFKSNFFLEKIEYDLSRPPNKEHFYVKRNPDRNYSYLTLNVYPKYYLGNVKYKGTSLWTGEKNTRALYLNLDLLYHEVKTFQVIHSVVPAGSVPDKKGAYFFKDTDGAFKQVAKRPEFSNHVKKVKAAIDGRTSFVYNETWPSQPKPLDLNNFNPEDLTVVTADLTNGVTQKTLTAKDVVPFNRLDFCGVVIWPTGKPAVNKPDVKEVVVVYKNYLLQFVHLKAMGIAVPLRGGAPATNTPTEMNLHFKKVEETFKPFAASDNFETLKQGLISGARHDSFVHLDLNQETLNPALYEVNSTYEDGVTKKVVTPKDTIKVTKLFSYNTDIWPRSRKLVDDVIKKYELYSYGNKKLLKLDIGPFDQSHPRTHEYYEKQDSTLAWSNFYRANFNDKLTVLKGTANLTPLELDVSVKPTTDYNVEVKSLSGNKTKLVLAPVQGKKITKVKHGTTDFFTSVNNNRAYKVELHLEEYSVRFVKVFVWKDVAHCSPLLTEEKRFKDVTASSTTWTSTNFDEKLREFEATTSTVPFTYSETWVLPSMIFDPKTSHRFYFPSTIHTEGLVTTTTYTPREGTVVHKVLLDGYKVWPDTADGSGDTAKKLAHLKVLSKNDMVQLLHLRNVLVANPNTTEDLYYKKVMDTYEKLVNVEKFNELKETLSKADTYVDQNVKLDLSSTEETSTRLFDKETTLEDGVEKTVVVVKAGKLFQVSASPPLWESRDGSYVTRLERYVLDMTQFLVLHITKSTGGQETKFFEKPVRAPEPPPGPSGEPSRPEASQTTEEQRRQAQQQQQDSQARVQDPPSTPSFSALGGIDTFVAKLNRAKAQVRHDEVPLDVAAYAGDNNFEVKEVEEGTTRLFKVYPKKTFWVTRLLNTSGVELWTKKADGERLVEVFLYLHDTKLKFVKALVWPNNRTNASQDKLLHFKLENERLVEKTPEQFAKELEELTKVPPTPLSTQKYAPPEPVPYFFHKLYLSDTVDTNLFEFTESTAGAYKLKNYAVKQHKFVNAVETQHGLLWKAEDNQDHMKSTHFAVTENSALARLTLSVNSQPMDMFFKFEYDRWHNLDSKTYGELYAKTGLPSS